MAGDLSSSGTSDGTVVAAGAVVWRPDPAHPGEVEVCVVHRPRYDDWSLPKGKLDRGEHLLAGAVREVEEETGQRVVLDRPLPTQHYEVNGVPKRVHYWPPAPTTMRRRGRAPRRSTRSLSCPPRRPLAGSLTPATPRWSPTSSPVRSARFRSSCFAIPRRSIGRHGTGPMRSAAEQARRSGCTSPGSAGSRARAHPGGVQRRGSVCRQCAAVRRRHRRAVRASARAVGGRPPRAAARRGKGDPGSTRRRRTDRRLLAPAGTSLRDRRGRGAGTDLAPTEPLHVGDFLVFHHRGGVPVAVERFHI